jgi:LPXTG-motif cell wall-anchored protein
MGLPALPAGGGGQYKGSDDNSQTTTTVTVNAGGIHGSNFPTPRGPGELTVVTAVAGFALLGFALWIATRKKGA